jgi:DNA mismatch endonuclease (patch repair protein)
MHPKIAGSPDIVIPEKKLAIFVHGCFWHKCKKCYKPPKTNVKYWLPKLKKNVARDKANALKLKRRGWKVLTLWEHEIKEGGFKRKLK